MKISFEAAFFYNDGAIFKRYEKLQAAVQYVNKNRGGYA